MDKHQVFVYGTLRRGGVREMPALFPGARFVDKARVRGRLYDFGEYPGLLLDESGAEVAGEVYEIDERILKQLDEIEAGSHYIRRRLEIAVGGRVEACWVYVYDPRFYKGETEIESGDWIAYARSKE